MVTLALHRSLAAHLAAAALAIPCVACGPRVQLGSNVSWATDHESGTLDDWLLPPGGGIFQDPTTKDTVSIAAGPAHSGRYSLMLSNGGTSDVDGPAVYREVVDPEEAYYSVWYYLPGPYTTNSQWTIQRFRRRSESDAGLVSHGHDL